MAAQHLDHEVPYEDENVNRKQLTAALLSLKQDERETFTAVMLTQHMQKFQQMEKAIHFGERRQDEIYIYILIIYIYM